MNRHGLVLSPILAIVLGMPAMAAAGGCNEAMVVPLSPFHGTPIPSFTLKSGDAEAIFLFDTAGGLTSVTPQFAKAVGCEPWGKVTGFRMRGDRVDLQRCEDIAFVVPATSVPASAHVSLDTAGVFDFARLLPPEVPRIGGLMALDAFADRVITLDLGNDRLLLETADSFKARIAGATEVPVRFVNGHDGLSLVPFIAVPTPKGTLWMELDSGSDAPLIVGRHTAQALGFDAAAKGRIPLAIKLADGVSLDSQAKVEDLILDGNIGAPLLRQWRVTIDFPNRRLWIAPAGKNDR